MTDIDLTARDPDNREYRNDRIVVTWEPALCIHSAVCVRSLSSVFDPVARPWVRLDRAGAEEIAEVVADCPSAALKYRWLPGKEPTDA